MDKENLKGLAETLESALGITSDDPLVWYTIVLKQPPGLDDRHSIHRVQSKDMFLAVAIARALSCKSDFAIPPDFEKFGPSKYQVLKLVSEEYGEINFDTAWQNYVARWVTSRDES